MLTQSVSYLSADDEDRYMIAQSDSRMAKDGKLLMILLELESEYDFPIVDSSEVLNIWMFLQIRY